MIEVAPNGDRFLTLLSGRRYEGSPGEPEFRVMEFERYMVRVEARRGIEPFATHRSLPTAR
jgi:lipopolysaccharide export system permease protein